MTEQSRRNRRAAGPSSPLLEGRAADEFLKTIEKNKARKVAKEHYDRAKRAWKNFTKPEL